MYFGLSVRNFFNIATFMLKNEILYVNTKRVNMESYDYKENVLLSTPLPALYRNKDDVSKFIKTSKSYFSI